MNGDESGGVPKKSKKIGLSTDRIVDITPLRQDEFVAIRDKELSLVLRIYKTTLTSQGIPKISRDQFIKLDVGDEYDTEFRTEMSLDTGMSLDVIHHRINVLLYGSKPVPLKLSDPGHGDVYMYCKSLKQVDLKDVRTTVSKVACDLERGGTKQRMIPITSTRVLLWAVTRIAYRDYVPQRDLSQTMNVDSYVLDVLISTSNFGLIYVGPQCQRSIVLVVVFTKP